MERHRRRFPPVPHPLITPILSNPRTVGYRLPLMVRFSALRALLGRLLQVRQSSPSTWVEPSNAVTRAIEGDLRATFEQAYAEPAAPAPATQAAPVYEPAPAPAVEPAPAAAQAPAAQEDSRAA